MGRADKKCSWMCKGKREHKIVMKKFDLNSICGRKSLLAVTTSKYCWVVYKPGKVGWWSVTAESRWSFLVIIKHSWLFWIAVKEAFFVMKTFWRMWNSRAILFSCLEGRRLMLCNFRSTKMLVPWLIPPASEETAFLRWIWSLYGREPHRHK